MCVLCVLLQRKRRAEIKQKLEFLAKLEIVEKVKVSICNNYNDY